MFEKKHGSAEENVLRYKAFSLHGHIEPTLGLETLTDLVAMNFTILVKREIN